MEKTISSPPPAGPATGQSEASLLADQAAAAQRTIAGTLERLRADLGASADLEAWARKYPWPTVGAAAALGFLAVVAVGNKPTPRGSEPAEPRGESHFAEGQKQSEHSAPGPRGLFASLLTELLRNLAGAVQGAVLAAIAARFQPPVAQATEPSSPDPSAADPTGSNGAGGASPSDY